MVSKHTPGPWSHRNGRIFQTDYDVLTIANVARAHDGDYNPSNGDLLAAAPELLEALIDCRRALELANFTQELAIVDAAIAKAKGETE